MANQIPLTGATNAAGGYLLPTRQGDVLVNGLLQEAGALQLAGDRRATSVRQETFPIWLGTPTAGFVGEGARKPVTGAEFSTAAINIKKIASIVLFTDELRDDVANGNLDPLVDTGIRSAIADVIDANIGGKDSGVDITSAFDSMLRSTTATVELGTTQDKLRLGVSQAMGILENNGYGNQGNIAVLLPADVRQHLRDARTALDTTRPLYEEDPIYGLQREFSTNLNTFATTPAAGVVKGFVVHKPNLHVRIRRDVTVAVTNEATVNDGTSDRFAFQEDLTFLRYVTRLGFMVHDINRSVVKLIDAA